MADFTYIQTLEQLRLASEAWNQLDELAIDIECENNLHHYGSFISLIQLSAPGKNWIVDVLTLKEIGPLLEVLENPRVKKVFHDVGFDLRILNHQFGCRPRNVFDTQLAALFLGKENLGLGALLEEFFQVKKEKKFQRVDWTRRPLSREMLNYAVEDTAHLLSLKEKLEKELQKINRCEWVREECAFLEEMDFSFHEQTYLDIKGARSLAPVELGRLQVIFEERSRLARTADKPLFMIFDNQRMLDFARNPPLDWSKLRGVHPLVSRKAQEFAEAVKKARPETYPREEKMRMTGYQRQKAKEITELRNQMAEKLGIRAHLVLSNEQIVRAAVSHSLEELRKWQRNLLEKEIDVCA